MVLFSRLLFNQVNAAFLGSSGIRGDDASSTNRSNKRRPGVPCLYEQQGRPFERYCGNLISAIATHRGGSGAQAVGPFRSSDREIDKIYVENGKAVFFECKGGVVRPSARFGTTTDPLRLELEKKFIFGTKRDPKGLKQLEVRCHRQLSDPNTYGIGRMSEIWPVLVVEDEFLEFSALDEYCRKASAPMFEQLGETVKPPRVLHAENIRAMLARSRTVGPVEILDRAEREGLGGAFTFQQWLDVSTPLHRDDPDRVRPGSVWEEIPFLKEAFDLVLLRFATGHQAPSCRCGNPLALAGKQGTPHWICTACGRDAGVANGDDVEAFEADKLAAMRRYEDGRLLKPEGPAPWDPRSEK